MALGCFFPEPFGKFFMGKCLNANLVARDRQTALIEKCLRTLPGSSLV